MPDDSAAQITPHAAVLTPPTRSPPRAPWPFVRDQLARGYVAPITGLGAIIALHALVDAVVPLVLGALVDSVVARDATPQNAWRSPWALFAALAALWVAGPQIARLYQLIHPRVFIPLRTRIYDELFAHVLGQSPRFFMDEPAGTLAQKIRNVGNAVFMLVETVCSSFVRIVTLLIVAAWLVGRAAPELLIALAAFVALFVAVSVAFSRRCRPFAVEAARTGSVFAGRLADALSNWDAILSFARGGFERALIGPFAGAEQDAIIRWRAELVKMRVLLNLLSLAFVIALAAGALDQALSGDLPVGSFVAIVTVGVLIAGYVVNLGDSILMMQEWYGQLVDGLVTVAAAHEIADAPGAEPLRATRGAIELRDVTFNYPDGTRVFAGLSLSIGAGERIGLVGPSGAGKSTLIRLIRRQFNIQRGAILIDGQDIAQATWDSLHDAIAEVPQSPGMFHRTVRENIAYGRIGAGEDEIREAARLAHCHDFIAARSLGYDAVVGEKGMKLSGGERQRVAIARAFLKNAPILILDEATSSLDSDAEHLIQDALLTLMQGRTVIAIAHRLSTIMSMDRIIVLDGGRIAEQGTHAGLLAAQGIYARLWARQAGGFI